MSEHRVILTSDWADEIARSIRDQVSDSYQSGTLTDFAQGLYQGRMNMLSCFMGSDGWVMQGIENEINFYCRRAAHLE